MTKKKVKTITIVTFWWSKKNKEKRGYSKVLEVILLF
jgi:hypothetical protein